MIQEKNKCIDDCKNDDIYKYLYNGNCFRDCPENTIQENYLCKEQNADIKCILNEKEIKEDNIYNNDLINSIVKSYRNEYSYTNKHISKYINSEYNIFIYKDSDCIDNLSLGIVKIEPNSCINKVKENYNIEENLIIVYFERKRIKTTGYMLYNPITGIKIEFENICTNEDIKTIDDFKYIEIKVGECPSDLYPIVYLNQPISYDNCKNKSLIYNKIYFDPIEQVFFPCYKNCKICEKKEDNNNHNCLSCEDGYIRHPLSIGINFNCVKKCMYNYYLTLDGEYLCTDTPECPDEYDKLIKEKNQCIDDCKKDDNYKFLYENKCLIGCPMNAPYEIKTFKICTKDCLTEDFFLNKCKINNKEDIIKDELINKTISDITKGLLNKSINLFIIEKNQDLVYQDDGFTFQIISNLNHNNSINNISSLDLGECENKIKKYYNISKNEPLIIFKIDYVIPELFIPIVEYKVFHSLTKKPLNLDICEENNIIISYPIFKELEKETFKYDINSEYYNDKCFPYTSKNSTDIINNDRKEIYNKNNLSLCENKCKLLEIDTITQKSKCQCEIKNDIKKLIDIKIDKDKLLNNFINIKSTINIDVIFCYKTLFSVNGIKNNIGSYIMLFIILIHLINCIVFYYKGKKIFFQKINNILFHKKLTKE